MNTYEEEALADETEQFDTFNEGIHTVTVKTERCRVQFYVPPSVARAGSHPIPQLSTNKVKLPKLTIHIQKGQDSHEWHTYKNRKR